MIYKLLREEEWAAFQKAGAFAGSPLDLNDGYLHFSTAAQARETKERHFAGVETVILAEVSEAGLALKWEPSRGGQLFPHLYAPLPLSAVTRHWTLTGDASWPLDA